MNVFVYDYKLALAGLRRRKLFIISILLTMGITLGTLFCIVALNHLLFAKSLPYPDQQHLYVVEQAAFNQKNENFPHTYAYPGLVQLYEKQDVFEQGAMMAYSQEILTSDSSQPTLNTTYTSPELHKMLATPMVLGRNFQESESLGSYNPVAVISYQTWEKHFNKRKDILEQKITVSGVGFSIIGVTAIDFMEPQIYSTGHQTHIWMPWDYNPIPEHVRNNWNILRSGLFFIGKLKQNVNTVVAEGLLTPLINDRWQEEVIGNNFFNGWHLEMQLIPLRDIVLGDSQSVAFLLLLGAISLVAIALANITNLYLSRTAEQQKQIAIHASIGARKNQIFTLMFAESFLLMGLATVIALSLTSIGFKLLRDYFDKVLPRLDELSLNSTTILTAIFIAIASSFLIAKVRCSILNYRNLVDLLQSSGKGNGIQVSKKVRQTIVACQVTFATSLILINATLFTKAFSLINEPIGFSTTNNYSLVLTSSNSNRPSKNELSTVMNEIKSGLLLSPKIDSISHASSPLFFPRAWPLESLANNEKFSPFVKEIDHNYFQLIDQNLSKGNFFSESDIKDDRNVVIVNNSFANALESDGQAVGTQLKTGDEIYTIIGVVKDISYPDAPRDSMRIYTTKSKSGLNFVIKAKRGQSIDRKDIVSVVKSIDRRFAVFEFEPIEDIHSQMLFVQTTTATTTFFLSLLVLFLAGIGLYGVFSYGTQLRRFELGCRLAIGAKSKDIFNLIVRDNISGILWGFVVSGVVLLTLAKIYGQLITPYWGWHTFFVAFGTILAVSITCLVACYLPLRRYLNSPIIYSLKDQPAN